MGLVMKSRKKARGRPTLGKRASKAIAEGNTGPKVNPVALQKSLQALLDADKHPGDEAIAVIADLRHLAAVPAEAKPLIERVLAKYPYTKRERFNWWK